MNCPYCNFQFKIFAMNKDEQFDIAPILCEDCGQVGLTNGEHVRKIAPDELADLKESLAWREFIAPVQRLILDVIKAKNAKNN